MRNRGTHRLHQLAGGRELQTIPISVPDWNVLRPQARGRHDVWEYRALLHAVATFLGFPVCLPLCKVPVAVTERGMTASVVV
jgi:hypothetical protein